MPVSYTHLDVYKRQHTHYFIQFYFTFSFTRKTDTRKFYFTRFILRVIFSDVRFIMCDLSIIVFQDA